jgi:hypothetical protein
MVKIINKTRIDVAIEEIPVGECFILNGEPYMRVRNNGHYASVRLSSGVVQTNIHEGTKVKPVNVTIEVGS